MKVYRKSRSAYSIITFFSASVVTLLAMAIVYYEQREDNLHVFENLTQRQTDALQRSVLNDINYIGAAANFFHSNFPENWGQFSVFAHELINNSPSLITLQWQPKVEVHEINDHVAKARKIFPDYRLYTIPKDGKKTYGYVMKNQAPIFVMSDIYPRTPVNIGLLGFYSTKLRFELVLSLGWAYYRLGRYEDAVVELETALEKMPSDPVIIDHLGDAYWKTGRKLEAIYQWRHALSSNPTEEDAAKIQEKIRHGLIN